MAIGEKTTHLKTLEQFLPALLVFDDSYKVLYCSDKALKVLKNSSFNGDKLSNLLGSKMWDQFEKQWTKNFNSFSITTSFNGNTDGQLLLNILPSDDYEGAWVMHIDVPNLEHSPKRGIVLPGKNSSTEKYRVIFDSTLDAIILSDFDSATAVECNHRATEMFNASYDEIVTGGVIQFSPEYQPDGLKSTDKLAAIKKEMLNSKKEKKIFKWCYNRKDGELFDAEVVVSLFEVNGQKKWMNIIRDVSDRVENEKKLETSHHKFKALFNNTAAVTFLLDTEGNILEANNSAREKLNINILEDKNQPIWQCGWWKSNTYIVANETMKQAVKEVVVTEKLKQFDFKFHDGEEKEHTYIFTVKPFAEPNGDVNQIIIEGNDITELIEKREEVLKNERLYRSIIRNTQGTSVFLINKNQEIVLVEGNYNEMFNLEIDQLMGFKPSELVPTKQINEILNERFENALKGQLGIFDLSYGRTHYHVKTLPLREFDGLIKKAMVIVQDITDIKKAEKELRANVKKLNEQKHELELYIDSNKDLENFAYIVSHDLKEPLRNIMSFTQLVQENYSQNFDQIGKEFLDYIINGGQQMNDLINSLLEYSRVKKGEYHFQKINLSEVFSLATNNLMNSILEARASINLVKGVPEFIVADIKRIAQLLQNLMSNSIRYCNPDPEVQPIVEISVETRPYDWLFTVKDNGQGIAEEHHESIFSIFSKVSTGKKKGTGIGLAVCKRIVEQHKGDMWVESKVGEGSTFFFTISKGLKIGRTEES